MLHYAPYQTLHHCSAIRMSVVSPYKAVLYGAFIPLQDGALLPNKTVLYSTSPLYKMVPYAPATKRCSTHARPNHFLVSRPNIEIRRQYFAQPKPESNPLLSLAHTIVILLCFALNTDVP